MSDETIISPGAQKRIGKYLVDGILGQGAMGIVYAGHDPDIDRQVAIKTVHPHLIDAAGGEDWLVRFAREARAGGRVVHQNLVTIFDYLEQDRTPYLVMERVRSTTLEDRLHAANKMQLDEIHAIMAQILAGLDCIHDAGIVHRDLKPANVMITDNGTVKLTDFGIARLTSMEQTGAGMVGTPSYMAPEQFAGGDVDARADIYASGVLLYELITGQKPFKGGGIEALLLAVQTGEVTPPSALAPEIPEALDAVVLKAMSVDAGNRFSSAALMRDALQNLMSSAPNVGHINLTAPTRRASTPSTAASNTMLSRLPAQTMLMVESNLIAKIGPMGKLIARRAAARATTGEELLDLVLSEMTHANERQELREAVLQLLSDAVPAGPEGELSAMTLSGMTDLLALYIGPMARMLVKRHAAHEKTPIALAHALVASISDPSDKAAFLARATQEFGGSTSPDRGT